MMGMGEPLYNFDNVKQALHIVADGDGIALSKRRITLSTSGVVPMIARAGEEIGVLLAISLHAVTDELRDELVPLNKKYPIAELIAACRAYPGLSNARRITFEYVMLKGINDSPAEARALVKLLAGIPAKINLIPFNPWPGSGYECSDWETIERFADIVNRAGYASPVRTPRGRDILAACGQLKSESERLQHPRAHGAGSDDRGVAARYGGRPPPPPLPGAARLHRRGVWPRRSPSSPAGTAMRPAPSSPMSRPATSSAWPSGWCCEVGALAVIPAFIVIVLAELFGWRSVFFYLAVGRRPRAADQPVARHASGRRGTDQLLLPAAGFVGGFVYWLIAGRLAGIARHAPNRHHHRLRRLLRLGEDQPRGEGAEHAGKQPVDDAGRASASA